MLKIFKRGLKSKKHQSIREVSLFAIWWSLLGRAPEGNEFIKGELSTFKKRTIQDYIKHIRDSEEYKSRIKIEYSEIIQFEEASKIQELTIDPVSDVNYLFEDNKIGLVNWHQDLTKNILRIYPEAKLIQGGENRPSIEEVRNMNLDVIINHHDKTNNKIFDEIPYIVAIYGSVSRDQVDVWNSDKLCKGIIDQSGTMSIQYPYIYKPIRIYKQTHPGVPIYKSTGSKVISLIHNYRNRFEEAYTVAAEITPFLYENVNDIEALSDAKWLLHIKPNGHICNAVTKALRCGVPVIMDIDTWKNGSYGCYVRNNDNAIVLPLEYIKPFLRNCTEGLYNRIKQNCVTYAVEERAKYG
jgi:hypothetical protein